MVPGVNGENTYYHTHACGTLFLWVFQKRKSSRASIQPGGFKELL